MKRQEVIDKLKNGAHIIAAIGGVSLREPNKKPVSLRLSTFHYLVESETIDTSQSGTGWDQYTLKSKKCQHKNWSRIGTSEEIKCCFDCGASVRQMLDEALRFRATVDGCILAMDKHPESKIFSDFLKSRLFDNNDNTEKLR